MWFCILLASLNFKRRKCLSISLPNLSRLHFCMVRGWLKYGLNADLINEKSLNVKMTNVGGNSPVFQLYGKIVLFSFSMNTCKIS